MRSADILIENTNDIVVLICSDNPDAQQSLFGSSPRLRQFLNVEITRSTPECSKAFSRAKDKKIAVFIDVTSGDTSELEDILYSSHAEKRGVIIGFSFGAVPTEIFDLLIFSGFDDILELKKADNRTPTRIYSWLRRFSENPVAARDAIRNLSEKLGSKYLQIGKWKIYKRDFLARDNEGHSVKLTKQETDFLTLMESGAVSIDAASYAMMFKAPHAIANNLKRKLGEDLPIRHQGNGKYELTA